jgi:hypothetical protein
MDQVQKKLADIFNMPTQLVQQSEEIDAAYINCGTFLTSKKSAQIEYGDESFILTKECGLFLATGVGWTNKSSSEILIFDVLVKCGECCGIWDMEIDEDCDSSDEICPKKLASDALQKIFDPCVMNSDVKHYACPESNGIHLPFLKNYCQALADAPVRLTCHLYEPEKPSQLEGIDRAIATEYLKLHATSRCYCLPVVVCSKKRAVITDYGGIMPWRIILHGPFAWKYLYASFYQCTLMIFSIDEYEALTKFIFLP